MKTIKKSMLTSFLSVMITSVVVTGTIGAVSSYVNSENILRQTMCETVKTAAGEIKNALLQSELLVRELGMNTQLTNDVFSEEKKLELLAEKAEYYGFIDYNITDTAGIDLDGEDMSGQSWFAPALAGETVVTDPVIAADGSSTIYIASTLVKTGKHVAVPTVGVIYTSVDAGRISEISSGIRLGNSGTAYVLDKNGCVIAHNDAEKVNSRYNAAEAAESDPSAAKRAELEQEAISLSQGQTLSGTFTEGGVAKYAVFTPIDGTNGWVIGIEADSSEFLGGTWLCMVLMIVCMVICIVISAVLINAAADRIVKPIKKIQGAMNDVARGDLSVTVDIKSKNEIGELGSSVNETVSALRECVGEISAAGEKLSLGDFDYHTDYDFRGDFRNIADSLHEIAVGLSDAIGQISVSANEVNAGAMNIADGSMALSDSVSDQAGYTEQLLGNIARIRAKVNSNAENADNASRKTMRAGECISESNEKIKEMTAAMEDIAKKSSEIVDIANTISDIAFQTNILSLNAAVEAARAGDAGKGFAVVADEVRNLATKCAKAVSRTSELIAQTLRAVENGTAVVGETAESLNEAVAVTGEAIALINEINSASHEQAEMVEKANEGIESISAAVQSNAATAEQSAAASQTLNEQAKMLRSLTDRFTLLKEASEVTRDSEETEESEVTADSEESAASEEPELVEE